MILPTPGDRFLEVVFSLKIPKFIKADLRDFKFGCQLTTRRKFENNFQVVTNMVYFQVSGRMAKLKCNILTNFIMQNIFASAQLPVI